MSEKSTTPGRKGGKREGGGKDEAEWRGRSRDSESERVEMQKWGVRCTVDKEGLMYCTYMGVNDGNAMRGRQEGFVSTNVDQDTPLNRPG